jgi:uncharacterized membrane protein YhaH (DUF805 family)
VNFTTAVKTVFKKYATFTGVATRPEYWWFFLFNVIVGIILSITRVFALQIVWDLATLVPGIAVAVRRFHDTGRSAWWLFTSLIPPWAIVMLCLPGKLEGNKYAPDRTSLASAPTVTEAHLTSTSAACPSCGKLRLPGQKYCMGCGAQFTD